MQAGVGKDEIMPLAQGMEPEGTSRSQWGGAAPFIVTSEEEHLAESDGEGSQVSLTTTASTSSRGSIVEDYDADLYSLVGSEPEGLHGGLVMDEDTEDEADRASSVYAASVYSRDSSAYQGERPVELDGDSELDAATLHSTRTLFADEIDYVYIHGRRYCGDYHMPCDEDEQTRQWLTHSVYIDLFHGLETTVPLEDPKYILDVGTGIGEWAVDIAERYQNCEVFGTDICPMQPTGQVPVNVEFNIEDAEEEWIRDADCFDLVHLRNMEGAFADWNFVYQQAFRCIRPGGWIEVMDFDDSWAVRNFLSFYPEGSPMHVLINAAEEAAKRAGRPKGVSHMNPQNLIDVGFVDIEESVYSLGLGERENSVHGNKWLLVCCLGFEAHFMRQLTGQMGWDVDYVHELCEKAKIETRRLADDPDRAKGFSVKLRVLTARKPTVPGQWTAQAFNDHREIEEQDDSSGEESSDGTESCWTMRSCESL